MQQFVTYLRVSTQRQGAGGLGVEAQRIAVENYLRGRGALIEEIVEVESGLKGGKARPALARALALCKDKKAALVIGKLDRLARDVRKRPTNTVLTQMLNRQQLLGAVYFINEMVVFIGSLDGGIQALEQIVQRLTGLAHQHCQAVVFVGCCGHAFKWRHGSNRNFPTPFNQRLEIDLPGLWLSPLPAFSGHVHAAFCSGARAAAISCARFHGSNSSTRLTG